EGKSTISLSTMTEPEPSATASMPSTTTVLNPPKPYLLVSKPAYRVVERNSSTIYAMASASKGSKIGRLSLACNELLREVCQKKVEKETLEQLNFYMREQKLHEEDAEPVIYLARSIRAIAESIGNLEVTVAPPPCTIKPPLDFGDGDDGMENMLVGTSGSASKPSRKRTLDPNALFCNDTDDDDDVKDSSGSKPVGPENDLTVKLRAVSRFRPLTPEDQIRDDPSPPPSPTIQSILSKRGRYHKEEVENYDEGEYTSHSPGASSVKNEAAYRCPMCDTLFYVQHQLNSHLISYHRVKPDFDDDEQDEPRSAAAGAAHAARPAQQGFARSTAIVTTRPLNGLHHSRPSNGTSFAPVRASEQVRLSGSTYVTSPGGTIRQYSSASNAARAAAKAAAAAEAGLLRPMVPSKPYTCRQCGVLLASQQMYASHVRYTHPKDKPVEFDKDGEPIVVKKVSSAGSKESAIVHLTLNDGTKAFQCRRCEKVFDSAQKVAGHSRHCLLVFEGKARPANQGPIPTEDRPYTVYRCGLGSQLARTCPYCGELLPSIRKVDKHVRHVHEASRHEVYGCTTCDRRFVTLGGIENHWLHYGDCPNGLLTVHRDGVVTCADIGDCPPQLKKPRVIVRSSKDDEDPSVSIVNTILGLHGFKVKSRGAPQLTRESKGHFNGNEDEEAAPELEDEMHNGDSHLEEEMEEFDDEEYKGASKKAIVSMKVITCRLCKYASRTRDEMDMHMAEEHPDEVLAGGSPVTNYEDMNGTHSVRQRGSVDLKRNSPPAALGASRLLTHLSKQSGEMQRILGISRK
ncbi:hypothetical protein PENTCL1PPCAC_29140, partial [Pristionchus entomophagus]